MHIGDPVTSRLGPSRLAPAPAGPRAAAWDPPAVQTRLRRAQVLVGALIHGVQGVSKTLHETIEASMLTDDKSIPDADREDMRRLVLALQVVESYTARLKKRWGWG